MKVINWLIIKLERGFEFFMALRKDKKKHAWVGGGIYVASLIGLGCRTFFGWENLLYIENQNWLFLTAAIITTIAAVGWELYQKKTGKGTPDIKDVVATIAIPWGITMIQLIFSLL